MGPDVIDERLFNSVNEFAQDTGWLHTPVLFFANYGVLVFGAILLIGWWRARRLGSVGVAASVWAGAATLIAVAVNQPLVNGVREARPYTLETNILV